MYLNYQGIDTIQLIAKYETVKKMVKKMDLILEKIPKNHKLYQKIIKETNSEIIEKTRRKKREFNPIIEIIKLPKVTPKDKYLQIVIIRNIPILFDIATYYKKAKDNFCMIIFNGLHQPQKKLNSKAIKIISKFLKRKTFKLYRLDFAKDIKDPKPINKDGLEAFIERFKPHSNSARRYLKTYYINNINHGSIKTILYYDKYKKAMEKKENIAFKYKDWKRLEIILLFDTTKPNSYNFIEYIKSMNFLDDFSDLEEITKRANIHDYNNDYLEYQINSFLDSRFMNNRYSQKQFNLNQALEYFKKSEFRRYVLPI